MDKKLTTPILFLIFNRPDTTKRVFEVISQTRPKQLFVAGDGPRADRPGEEEKCEKVRQIATNVDWDCEVKTLFREKNLGCRVAVSSAVDWFFENVEEGIILEDDCVPHPTFFRFCQELLERYRDDMRVMQIGSCNFQDGIKRGNGSYYFSKYNHIWGWASWRRAWCHYDVAMQTFPEFVVQKQIENIWPDKNTQKYWLNIFQTVFEGRIDTWDYQWIYAMWTQNSFAILPNVNMISNIGFDERAMHTKGDSHVSNMKTYELHEMVHPAFVLQDIEADKYTFEKNLFIPIHKRILQSIKRRVKKLFKILLKTIKAIYVNNRIHNQ